ncbi:helix-turn-helix transcriptional regulator [Parasphingopyxis marina]|uniref:Autoinducer binding domain-containing protein n=1 Tax=Parasphingopyxis marina TaxID=2761622 RepID=A0A842I2E8_9SPHN|nr:LuxR family transcriptional regulator [Parasphingopyxis marina]MBC2779187.1 autoinducer binding domain-containing protein [Parasphingopyxis marina]
MREIFERMRAAQDRHELWKVFVDYFRTHGVRTLCAMHIPPPGAPDGNRRIIDACGFLEPLIRAYISDGLWERDPIRKQVQIHPAPFFWSEIGELRKLDDGEQAFLAEFVAHGAGEGIAIPVFGPHGRNGYIGVALEPHRSHFSDTVLREFQAVAQMAHQRFCELLEPELIETVSLSRRETEILEWVARGKSNTVIGEILEISPNTVDTHIRRIYTKLDVSDRTMAALRGIGCGMILP